MKIRKEDLPKEIEIPINLMVDSDGELMPNKEAMIEKFNQEIAKIQAMLDEQD